MSEVSSVSADLFLLDSLHDFQEHSLKLIEQSRRTIAILSHDLDVLLYGAPEFVQAISNFVRSSRHAQVQILVKNTKPLAETGHDLAKLHQRLSSKILLRKLTVEPQNTEMGFMLCDTSALLYKNDDNNYKGFANFNAAVEVTRLRETFDYVWQYGEPEPELQTLHI
ncbi:hypothetical protein GCM10011613_08410 [Cellvibrio zantedeschiae]|uniref:DUF7931 domain-containing protein n=1 Tax=Cellvibrio zantedeschiae TaxID=1237077 RepID=A0ABQ3ATE8_9GAMM|nr:hypothetical protein [Cellvibrio zantedeschiae]GGY66724.1 hypothetical protein GCM10011613_08410 [Cellvibrio zantedeschiae]